MIFRRSSYLGWGSTDLGKKLLCANVASITIRGLYWTQLKMKVVGLMVWLLLVPHICIFMIASMRADFLSILLGVEDWTTSRQASKQAKWDLSMLSLLWSQPSAGKTAGSSTGGNICMNGHILCWWRVHMCKFATLNASVSGSSRMSPLNIRLLLSITIHI